MSSIIVLAMHGAPPNNFPGQEAAEFFALHGAYTRAIQHLEYARRLVSRDNAQLQAMLNQRINDLRTELRIAQS